MTVPQIGAECDISATLLRTCMGIKQKVPPFRLDGDGIEQAIVIAPRVLRQSDIFRMRFNLT